MRTKFSILNGVAGLVSQLFIIILGFISRSIFIEYLGDEILGLNGTFSNVLNILSISELGIGSAITFCLYKPIFEDDKDRIAGIMNLFKKVYIVIGSIIFIGALCFAPFIELILKDYTLDLNYIRLIFVIYAFNSTVTYFLGSYRTLFFASQQNYIVTLSDFFFKLILQVTQILILIYTRNFILYLSVAGLSNIATNLVIRHLFYKHFPYMIGNKTRIDDENKIQIINTVKYLSVSSLISVGVFGTDNLIISSLVGVGIAGFYSNYTMIIQNVQTLFTSLLNGVTASFGNMIAEGDKEKIRNVFNVYDYIYFVAASFTTVSLYILLNPFIRNIWIRKEEYVFPIVIVMVLVLNNFLTYKRQPIWQYQNTAGLFKYFLPYSFAEMIVNLVVSIVGAIRLGLIGVFIGTTAAYLCGWVGQIFVVHKHILSDSPYKYLLKQLFYGSLTVLEIVVVSSLGSALTFSSVWISFLYLMVLCAIVPNSLNILLFCRTAEFRYILDNIVGRFLKKRGNE